MLQTYIFDRIERASIREIQLFLDLWPNFKRKGLGESLSTGPALALLKVAQLQPDAELKAMAL